MPKKKNPDQIDQKEKYLRECGGLHPHPEKVRDDIFITNNFFDPRDLVQVRYEMIRSHRVDKKPVAQTTRRFGTSRPTFYQVATLYDRKGLIGLVPSKRGPKKPNKCTEDILKFVQERCAQDHDLAWDDLLREVNEKFGVTLHRRTVERGLARHRKKGRRPRSTGISRK
jgi:transposase